MVATLSIKMIIQQQQLLLLRAYWGVGTMLSALHIISKFRRNAHQATNSLVF